MLDVDGRHDVDAGVEQLKDIFVALAIFAAGNVGVGEFVDDNGVGMAGDDGVDVHLLQVDATIRDNALRDDFEVADAGLGFGTAVGFNKADDDIDGLLVDHAIGVVDHVIGFADAGSRTDVDA